MDTLDSALAQAADALYSSILVWLLLGAGLLFTVATRAVQVRHLGSVARAVSGSRQGAAGGISSFQAFAIGLACRVGTGNIVGVALALVLGGPGAVFWMWVVAVLGMSTAFIESTLAQVFKVAHGDGTFRGGPAYYISRGLHLPVVGVVFAVVFMVANGLAMPMVQSNAMTASLTRTTGAEPWVGAVLVVVLTAPVLLGGLRSIAHVAEYLAPMMALAYLGLVALILLAHPLATVDAFLDILMGAFGLRAGLAGLAGGVTQAVLNGVRRGLFSNEAGLGGPPSVAGSATVDHPVQQGFIQSFGVVVDTLVICTATALAILVAGPEVYTPGTTGREVSGTLTQQAVSHVLGSWTEWPMTLLVLVLAYTTIIGAFSYAQVSLDFLTARPWAARSLQAGAVVCAAVGAFQELVTVWTLADLLLGLGAVLNLAALVLLVRWSTGSLRDWEAQRRAGVTRPVFTADSPYLPGRLPDGVWPTGAERLRRRRAARPAG